MALQYPIGAVARLTGLSLDTLRAWERRYQTVSPARDDRGRVYSARQVERLKRLGTLVGHGHPIGSIAGLSDAALRKMADSEAPPSPSAAAPSADLEPLRRALARYDLAALESILNRQALLMPPHDVIFDLILPLLVDIGRRWQAGTIRPAQEHLVSCVIRTTLGGLLRTLNRPASPARVVLAAPAGERHELGLLCAAVLAAAAGCAVTYLGPDLPAADLVHAVAATKPDTVVLSATMPRAGGRVEDARLRRLPDRVTIWAGGAEATALGAAIGSRAVVVPSLQDLYERFGAHVG